MASVYFYVNILVKAYSVAIISYAQDLIGQVGMSLVPEISLTKIAEQMLPQLRK